MYDETTYRARVLSSATRLTIWQLIASHESYPSDLARTLSLTPGTISHHLNVLKQAGLVRDVPQGRCRLYESTGERWGILSEEEIAAGVE